MFFKKQDFFVSITAKPVRNSVIFNSVNNSEAMFIIKSTIINIFSRHHGISAQTHAM